MLDNPVSGAIFWVGAVAIVAIFGLVSYRVGKFAPVTGEWRNIGLSWAVVLVGGLALTAAIPLANRNLGWSAELTVALLIGALGLMLLLTRGRRARRLAANLEQRSPMIQAEYARRASFLRSRLGRWLTVAMLATVMIWALAIAFVGASPRTP